MDKKGDTGNNATDSDASAETNSLSADSTVENPPPRPNSKIRRRDSEWEVIEGLKEGQRFEKFPEVYSGFLHKKRKWPLKGWHKRFFVLDKGILSYSKNVSRKKIHGSVDVGLSVISSKKNGHRIDIDAEEFIYHLKVKSEESFYAWLRQLKEHRLYRQHALSYGSKLNLLPTNRNGKHLPPMKVSTSEDLKLLKSQDSSFGAVSNWAKTIKLPLDQAHRDIKVIEKKIVQLAGILQAEESKILKLNRKGASSDPENISFVHKRTASDFTTNFVTSSANDSTTVHSLQLQPKESFIKVAQDVYNGLKGVFTTLNTQQELLQKFVRDETQLQLVSSNNNEVIADLKNSLQETLYQNNELRKRLKYIHDASDSSDLSQFESGSKMQVLTNRSLSSSSCKSNSEFFDAEDLPMDDQDKTEVPTGDNETRISTRGSDTSSEAGSLSSDLGSSSESELEADYATVSSRMSKEGVQGLTGRRTILPVPRPSTEGLSLWNLLYKNIGKDLSQISMPVALNEPLNILQRLCEELEYSELLDKASELDDPYERMVYVAAFAVSAYASSFSRAGNKPFNPLLGETYECIREDKGFSFLAEQVSHHPPVSACHAESKNFIFWQEARVKTKFWGKSMEFQPLGKIHVFLPRTGDTYSWNKVTTCVHNLFSSQRWVDQYGELLISNEHISCRLAFAKTSYWSSKKHEVMGTVLDENGRPVRQLFGKWSEGLYCGVAPSARCIWRAGTLPSNHERYYGFTRFAIELNELGPDSHLLPPTDTRLRPDQRALEEGNLTAAEELKLRLENAQRERRKQREAEGKEHCPLWFRKNDAGATTEEEEWLYNGRYWDARRNGGFSHIRFEPLW